MEVAEHYERLRGCGAGVAVVSFAGPKRVGEYQQRYLLPFQVYADPQRAVYRAFGLGRAGWGRILGFKVIRRYLALMLRGLVPGLPGEGEDPHQLGGDFVLDARQRLVYGHRSRDPADRPSALELVTAVETAVNRATV